MGVDPGVRGGLAILSAAGVVRHVCAFRPDMTREDLAAALLTGAQLLKLAGGRHVYLERVNSRPGEGHQGAFTFGRVYGGLEQGLLGHGLLLCDVYPLTWQARLGCLTGGNKNVSKRRATELFPSVKVTHMIADALLIAEYGRRCQAPAQDPLL